MKNLNAFNRNASEIARTDDEQSSSEACSQNERHKHCAQTKTRKGRLLFVSILHSVLTIASALLLGYKTTINAYTLERPIRGGGFRVRRKVSSVLDALLGLEMNVLFPFNTQPQRG